MERLKELPGMFLYVLAANPVALRIATGIAALTVLWLLISLVFAFPVLFTALFMLCMIGFVVYFLGNVIWSFIES